MWAAGTMALAGSLLLAADTPAMAGRVGGGVTLGDGALMLAALLWSVHILRVGRYVDPQKCFHVSHKPGNGTHVPPKRHTARFDSFNLAMRQLAATAAASALLLAGQALLSSAGIGPPPRLWPTYGGDTAAWLLLFYPAFGPWAAGTWLQYAGQGRNVTPAAATIILATDPLWTALLAWLFLGAAELHLGTFGVIGAVLILGASLVAGGGAHGVRQ